jgi:hypothetical protein
MEHLELPYLPAIPGNNPNFLLKETDMSGTLTINIVAPSTNEINTTNGQMSQSLPGHIWYTVTDSNGVSQSFGFDPMQKGSPFGQGNVATDDSSVYQGRYFAQSAPLTDAEVQAFINYGQTTEYLTEGTGALDDPNISFNTNYNVLGGFFGDQGIFGNNCESYVNGAFAYVSEQTGLELDSSIYAFSLPEWQAGNAAEILGGVSDQNGGSIVTSTGTYGSNDEYTSTITGDYSAPDSSGNRTLFSDSWTESDGSHGTDVYSSTNNFTSTTVDPNGGTTFIQDIGGVVTDNVFAVNHQLVPRGSPQLISLDSNSDYGVRACAA